MASPLYHYREAERLLGEADRWLNADTGWQAALGAQERRERRANDLAAAQVHATLAVAAAGAAGLITDMGGDL